MALNYFAQGGKIKRGTNVDESTKRGRGVTQESGEHWTNTRWAVGFEKETDLPSVERVAEMLNEQTENPVDEGELRDAIIDIVNSFGSVEEVRNEVLKRSEEGIDDAFSQYYNQEVQDQVESPLESNDELTYKTDSNGKSFVKNSEGSVIFGEISPAVSEQIRRQAGVILLSEGNGDYGLQHIRERRESALKDLGYDSVESMVEDVTKNYNEIRKDDAGKLMLVKRNGKDKVAVIKLTPTNNEEAYVVTTAGVMRKSTINKKGLLWQSEPAQEPTISSPDSQPTTSFAQNGKDRGLNANSEESFDKGSKKTETLLEDDDDFWDELSHNAGIDVPFQRGDKKFEKISKARFDALINRLKKPFAKAFKNLNVTTDLEAFKRRAIALNSKRQDVQQMRTSKGIVYGAKLSDGTIYINPNHLNANTPIHEFSHLWEQLLPNSWKQGVALFKQTKLGQELFTELRQNAGYNHLTDEQLWSEALNTHIGNYGERKYNSPEMQKVWDWFKDLIEKIGRYFKAEISPEMHLKDFTDKVMGDLLGKRVLESEQSETEEPNTKYSLYKESDFDREGNVKPEVLEEIKDEREKIVLEAKAKGTYMKAPNGANTNLTAEQWTLTRTRRFKDWFGDWEKGARIEKLKASKPIEISAESYQGKYDLNRESAKRWILENLRGEYTNKDTGEKIAVTRLGANKATSHSMGNIAHLKSIVAIPEMIENATFISEEKAEKANAKYENYRYYVIGVKIGGENYTAKITIGVDKHGKKFYDHALTQIEKGALIDKINNQNSQGFISTEDTTNPSVASGKDRKLLSILQNDSSKVVDENGEPMVVYHGTQTQFDIFDTPLNMQRIFLTMDKSFAQKYGKIVMPLFANVRNIIYVDYQGLNAFDEIEVDGETLGDIEELAEYALIQDYDGVMVFNVEDIGTTSSQSSVTNEVIVFNPNQIKSATENIGTYDGNNKGIRFQIIGEKGALNIDRQESPMQMERTRAKAIAEQMEEAGKSAEEIFSATGWERGKDNKWRYEIQDFELIHGIFDNNGSYERAETMGELFQKGYKSEEIKLGKLAPNEKAGYKMEKSLGENNLFSRLFIAYPELRNVSLRLIKDGDNIVNGYYSPSDNAIYLRGDLRIEDANRVLLHEIQHVIQEKEGFSRGSNQFADRDEYRRTSGEVEARNVEKRVGMTEAERKSTPISKTEDVSREEQINNRRVEDIFEDNLSIEPRKIVHRYELGGKKYLAYSDGTFTTANKQGEQQEVTNANRIKQLKELSERTKAESERVNTDFNVDLERLIAGELPAGHIMQLGKPSEVLQSAGVANLPIELSADRLVKKSSENYKNRHPFDLSTIKDLPNAIQNPIAVFNNPNNDGHVLLTNLKSKGVNHIAVLKVRTTRGANEVSLENNSVVTVFPKDRVEDVAKWILENRATYLNKEKASEWLSDNKTTLSSKGHTLEALTKVIKEFENPIEVGDKNETTEIEDFGEGVQFQITHPSPNANGNSYVDTFKKRNKILSKLYKLANQLTYSYKGFAKEYKPMLKSLRDEKRDYERHLSMFTDRLDREAKELNVLQKNLRKRSNGDAKKFKAYLEAINFYLSGGNIDLSSILTQEEIAMLDEKRLRIDGYSQQVVESLREEVEILKDRKTRAKSANEAQAIERSIQHKTNLANKIEQNKGQYMNRAYKAFMDEGYVPSDEVVANAVDFFMREGMSLEEAELEVEKILLEAQSKDAVSFASNIEASTKSKALKSRKNVPYEIRELLGEIKDPFFNYAHTVKMQTDMIASFEYQKKVRELLLSTGLARDDAYLCRPVQNRSV